MSIDRGMDKEDVIYIYTMEYYSVIKKKKDSLTCSDVDEPKPCHTKQS